MKKAQEEMVGFIIIVVMMIVAGLILMFMVKPKAEVQKDLQAGNMLNALLESTEQDKKVSSWIESCTEGISTDCVIATNAVNQRLDASFKSYDIVLNRTINGYSLQALSEGGGVMFNVTNGSLMGNKVSTIVPLRDIDIILKFYY